MALNQLLADASYSLQGPGTTATGVPALEKILSQVIGIMSICAILYFVFQVIIASYSWISSQGDPKAIETARHALTNSILGLTITIVAVALGSLIATLAGINNPLDIESLFSAMGL